MKYNRREFLQRGTMLAGCVPLIGLPFGMGSQQVRPLSSASGQKAIPVNGLESVVIEKLLAIAMANGGDFAEIFFENAQSRSLLMKEGAIRNTQLNYEQGVGIRVLSGHKTGYAYADDLNMDSLEQAARIAANIAQSPRAVGPFPVTRKEAPQYYSIQKPFADVVMKDKVALVKRGYDHGIKQDSRIKQFTISYIDNTRKIQVANSAGVMISDEQCFSMYVALAVVAEKDRNEFGFYADGGRLGFEVYDMITPEHIATEAVKIAVRNLSAGESPSGPMEVVLNGRYAGVLLHEAIGHPLEGDANRKKQSLYSDKFGQKICPEQITIVDDGSYNPKDGGTINIDDEGNVGRRTVLIEQGKLVSYMQDQLNAKLMNMAITGNGRRQSYRYSPMPRMTNTMMLPGQYPPEEIISSVKKGFYAKAISNGQVNTSSGDFMFFVDEAYLIEDGKLTQPVKGASLIGNGPQILSRITMVGNDFAMGPSSFMCGKEGQMVNVGFGMPTVKVSEITVGGTKS
ncbi:TldD/PmbA family protein [bacterium]|nr:TldD/PmbA family protein [bacterium]